MKVAEFAAIVALIRVWESKLLGKSQYERLIEADGFEETLKLFQETPYGSFLEGRDFEAALNSAARNMYEDLSKAVPYKILVDFMRLKYDYHNMKVLVKGKLLEKDFSSILIPNGIVEAVELKSSVDNDEPKIFGEVKESKAKDDNPKAIMKAAIEAVLKDYEISKDPQRIDIILDKFMFAHMRQIVKHIDNNFINKYVSILIDLTNIKTLLRVKNLNKEIAFFRELLIEGGTISNKTFNELYLESFEDISRRLSSTQYENMIKDSMDFFAKSNSLALLEKNIDNYLMDYMKKAKFMNLGPEPIVTYMYARETEIRNIRIILVGKLNKVSESLIRERLRDSYV